MGKVFSYFKKKKVKIEDELEEIKSNVKTSAERLVQLRGQQRQIMKNLFLYSFLIEILFFILYYFFIWNSDSPTTEKLIYASSFFIVLAIVIIVRFILNKYYARKNRYNW